MAVKKTGLGKGLESVFLDNSTPSSGGTSLMKISDVQPRKNQPRKSFESESLQALADSIASHGLLQPVAVRESPGGFYEIIAGERRWRAAKRAGLTEIPAVILDADGEKAAVMALAENLQREDLNPVEEAEGIRALVESFSLTQEECAARVGRSRPAVTNALRLLSLEEEILEFLRTGVLSGGHGRALLTLPAGKERIALAKEAAEGAWSVRRLEDEAKRRLNRKPPKEEDRAGFDYAAELSERLTRSFGRGVRIVPGKKKGKLELEYYGNEDLEALISRLKALENG